MRNAMHSYIYFCSLKYFCMSKKVRKCTRRSEGKEKSICVRLNKISREGCLMVFFTFENVLSKWRQINNPSITTVLSRKQTMAVNRITFQKWTWCNILGIFNIFFFSLCSFRGSGVIQYIDVPSEEIYLWNFPHLPCATNRSLFYFQCVFLFSFFISIH